jgi:hypothetical protein
VTLEDAVAAMAAALEPLRDEIPELQIYPYMNNNPTPPSIDIYPAEPFQEGAGFGVGEKQVRWTVRARVSTNDPESASLLLLRLLDCGHAASVEQALAGNGAGPVAVVPNDGQVSGFRVYDSDTGVIGAQWEMVMFV